jgi:hypothetical protein
MDASFRHLCKTHQRSCIDGTDRSPPVVKLLLRRRGIQRPEWGRALPFDDGQSGRSPRLLTLVGLGTADSTSGCNSLLESFGGRFAIQSLPGTFIKASRYGVEFGL